MKKNYTVLSIVLFFAYFDLSAANRIADDPTDATPLEPGERIPQVLVRDSEKGPISLNLLISEAPSVIVFYRGGWCPVCNQHKLNLKPLTNEFKMSGYQLVIISPDPPDLIFAGDFDSDTSDSFILLSDFQLEAARAFGVAFRAEDEHIEKAAQFDKRILERSKELRNVLPLTSVFVIDSNETVKFVHVSPNINELMSPEQILIEAQKALE